MTPFDSVYIPAISIKAYLERISVYGNCSISSLVLAVIYIYRIMSAKSQFIVTASRMHRILLASVLCATKFNDDEFYDNKYYARVSQ